MKIPIQKVLGYAFGLALGNLAYKFSFDQSWHYVFVKDLWIIPFLIAFELLAAIRRRLQPNNNHEEAP